MSGRLREVGAVFLRLGLTAFGGPAAHISLMRAELVGRRKWVSEAEFLDLLGAVNLIPGPNSTELAIHLGAKRAGGPGLILAGVCFILPAAILVGLLAWVYAKFGALPAATGILYAVKPVVLAVVAQAIAGLARPAVKMRALAVLGAGALLAAALGVGPLAVLLLTGALSSARRDWKTGALALAAVALAVLPAAFAPPASSKTPFSLTGLFVFFLQTGSVLYGSGYVLLAFLRDGLVTQRGWLTEGQLLDATAMGQITPGPVFTTATFIGQLLGGPAGAVVATVGIFAPSFLLVALTGPLVARLRKSPRAGAFLDGVNVAALALMAWILGPLARAALTNIWTITLAAVSAVLLVRFRVNSALLLLAAAALGWLAAVAGVL